MNEKIKKILLVESNHYLSMALMVALSTGLVDRAVLNVSRSCYQALYAVKTQPVDLVIVNNQLPCMSGPELISEIHKINPNIPAIVISEFETDHLPSRNGHINYDDLSKPYGLAKIYETVTSALQLDASNGKHIPKLSSEGKAKIKAKSVF